MKTITALVLAGILSGTAMAQSSAPKDKPQLTDSSKQSDRTSAKMVDEIRHQLVTLPYYGVFDWLEGQILPDGSVVLRGQVTRPTTKSDAASRVEALESVEKVVNEIEVLPVSSNDDQLRRQTYRAIFNFDSPLFQYALRAVPPIHIIVKGGRVTLKGIVMNAMDRQLAETYARQVPLVMEVTNELALDQPSK